MEGHNNKWKELLFYQKMVFTRVWDFTLRRSLLYILLLSSPQGSQLSIWYSMMPFRKGIWSFCSKVDLLNESGVNKISPHGKYIVCSSVPIGRNEWVQKVPKIIQVLKWKCYSYSNLSKNFVKNLTQGLKKYCLVVRDK